jgi:RNA polymerase sigma-70 factor (ECF subfamily)
MPKSMASAPASFGLDDVRRADFSFNARSVRPVQPGDNTGIGNTSSAAMGWTGDRDSFDRLMREHLPAAHRFAMRLTGEPHEAEEVVQDALLRVARSWQTFRGSSSFQTWLLRIVIHAAHDRRAARPVPPGLPDDPMDTRVSADPAVLASATDLGERIAGLVSALPRRQCEALVLTAYEGLSVAEAAAVLETTEQNVRTNVHFARRKLRKQLGGVLEDHRESDRPKRRR